MSEHSVQRWSEGAVPSGPSEEEWGKHASPLSFTGATHRMTAWAERWVEAKEGQSWSAVVWTTAVSAMMILYLVTAAWYLFLAFNVVGALMSFAVTVILWPLIPFSMMWLMFSLAPFGFRSHRKTQREQSAKMDEQLKAMQAIQANTAHRQEGEGR